MGDEDIVMVDGKNELCEDEYEADFESDGELVLPSPTPTRPITEVGECPPPSQDSVSTLSTRECDIADSGPCVPSCSSSDKEDGSDSRLHTLLNREQKDDDDGTWQLVKSKTKKKKDEEVREEIELPKKRTNSILDQLAADLSSQKVVNVDIKKATKSHEYLKSQWDKWVFARVIRVQASWLFYN